MAPHLLPRLLLLALLCSSPVLRAGHGDKMANHLLPQFGQRGTTVEVIQYGNWLTDIEEVFFYRDGIQCTKIEPHTEGHDGRFNQVPYKPGEAVRLHFAIAEDAPLGEYYFRIRSKKNLSELMSFWVTRFPVVLEEKFDSDGDERGFFDKPDFSQKIPMNTTVIGYQPWGPPQDVDLYRVEAKEGQRISAQLNSARLGTHIYGGMTDMAISITGPDGKRVARNDDSELFAQDPYVSFVAPYDGEYLIDVRQQMDYETMIRHYALHVGDFERPKLTYPLGGEAGTDVEVTVIDPSGSERKATATLPKEVGPFEASHLPIDEIGLLPKDHCPSPNQFRVARFRNILEDSNDHRTADKAQEVGDAPIALNGIIRTEGEVDWFRFSAKKGQRFRIRSYSMTLGSPLDPRIFLKPADATESRVDHDVDDSLWDGHDWEGHHYREQVKDRLDPIFMFEADADGDYVLGISDARRLYGADFVYRIEIQPHTDSIFAYFPNYPRAAPEVRDMVRVHRGATTARTIAIQNGFGSEYSGQIELKAVGLPKGVTFWCPQFTKDDPIILAEFRAEKNAPHSTALVDIIPVPAEKDSKLAGGYVLTTPAIQRRGGYSMLFHKSRKMCVSVLEPAPYEVSIEALRVGLAKNAELDLNIKVKRLGDFKGAVFLEMDWLPKGVTKQPPMTIPADKDGGVYKINATSQAVPGKYRISITARQSEGGFDRTGNNFHYTGSPFIDLDIVDPYLSIELERTAIERGKTGTIAANITHLRPFPGEASITLGRLPFGVRQTSIPKIKAGQGSVEIPVKVSPDILVDQYKQIFCEITITDSGQEIRQQSGDGVLRVDPNRG